MKYTYILLLLSLFPLLASNSCKKENNNSLYYQCKVDGQEYKPDNCANCLTCTIYKDTIFLLGANRDFEALAIEVKDKNGISIHSYSLDNDKANGGGAYKNSTTTNDRFDTDSSRRGIINVASLDKINKIISGSFSFQAYNPIRNKTANITDGSFRLKYTTY